MAQSLGCKEDDEVFGYLWMKSSHQQMCPTESHIIVVQYPDLFGVLVAFERCVNAAFQAHPNSIPCLQWSSVSHSVGKQGHSHKKCDLHHLPCCRLLPDCLFLQRRLALPVCNFLPNEGYKKKHPTFITYYHFLKQIWLLLKCFKSFLINFKASRHMFA